MHRFALLPSLLFLAACTAVHSQALPEAAQAHAELESCLAEGGHLVEVDRINNNHETDHGVITAFAVADDGLLAVGSSDGYVKFWSLDGLVASVIDEAILEGSVTSDIFSYGAGAITPEPSDLAFDGAELMLADGRGLVTGWLVDGTSRVVGGTTPDMRISAVAVDAARHRVAHADVSSGGNVMVREIGESALVFGPLSTEGVYVPDLAFFDDGRLVIVSFSDDGYIFVAIHSSEDPSRAIATTRVAVSNDARTRLLNMPREIAVAGDRVVVNAGAFTFFFDDELNEVARAESDTESQSRTITTSEHGRFAFGAEALADTNRAVVFDTTNGAPHSTFTPEGLAEQSLIALRRDAANDLLLAAYVGGEVVALSCAVAE